MLTCCKELCASVVSPQCALEETCAGIFGLSVRLAGFFSTLTMPFSCFGWLCCHSGARLLLLVTQEKTLASVSFWGKEACLLIADMLGGWWRGGGRAAGGGGGGGVVAVLLSALQLLRGLQNTNESMFKTWCFPLSTQPNRKGSQLRDTCGDRDIFPCRCHPNNKMLHLITGKSWATVKRPSIFLVVLWMHSSSACILLVLKWCSSPWTWRSLPASFLFLLFWLHFHLIRSVLSWEANTEGPPCFLAVPYGCC